MRKGITETVKPSRGTYEVLEEMVRLKAQEYIQEILEDELEAFLGRKKSERAKMVDGTHGYWSGHGKRKKFTVMNGTITVSRPRVKGTEERFESKIIPFFKRRSKDTKVMSSRLRFNAIASWMLSIGFMYLFRIRSSALIMSSALTSRIVMPRALMS